MRATLEIEAIADNMRRKMKIYREIVNIPRSGMGDVLLGKNPYSCWVARLTGFDPGYKFRRVFLRGTWDYSKANSKRSRGVFVRFILESGETYEVNNIKRRYFCTVTDSEEIKEVTGEEVDQWLRDHLVLPY